MAGRSALTIRLFAVLNLIVAVFGICLVTRTFSRVHNSVSYTTPGWYRPYVTMTAIDLVCLLGLLGTVLPLYRLQRTGLLICNILFSFEIAYFFCGVLFSLGLSMAGGRLARLGMSIAAASGIGSIGTAPQILTAYPVVALIGLNIAYKKLGMIERGPQQR